MFGSLRESFSCVPGFMPLPVSEQFLSPTRFLVKGPGLFPLGMLSLKGAAASPQPSSGQVQAGTHRAGPMAAQSLAAEVPGCHALIMRAQAWSWFFEDCVPKLSPGYQ